jgi:hypothetical protein
LKTSQVELKTAMLTISYDIGRYGDPFEVAEREQALLASLK